MMLINLFVIFISFTCCTSLELAKCSIYDEQCQLDFFQTIGRDLAFTGIPELGVPVIDPFKLTNVLMPILGLWNVTLIEGEATGIQKCLVTQYVTNVPERYKIPAMTCGKIVIKGNFKMTSSPIVKEQLTNIHGDGYVKITLENWYFKFRYPFRIVREADDKIYVKALFDKAVYETHMDKVTLEASGIKMGIIDISKQVNEFMNNHWKLVMTSDIGKFIKDQSAQYYYDIYSIFFNNVPGDQYLTDDLSKIVDEDNTLDAQQSVQKNEL